VELELKMGPFDVIEQFSIDPEPLTWCHPNTLILAVPSADPSTTNGALLEALIMELVDRWDIGQEISLQPSIDWPWTEPSVEPLDTMDWVS